MCVFTVWALVCVCVSGSMNCVHASVCPCARVYMCVCSHMQPKEKQKQRAGSLAGKENQQRKTEEEPHVGTDTQNKGVKESKRGKQGTEDRGRK